MKTASKKETLQGAVPGPLLSAGLVPAEHPLARLRTKPRVRSAAASAPAFPNQSNVVVIAGCAGNTGLRSTTTPQSVLSLREGKVRVRTAAHNARVHAHVCGGSSIPHQDPAKPTKRPARIVHQSALVNNLGGIEGLMEQAEKLSKPQRKEFLARLALLAKMTTRAVVSRDLEMWSAEVQRELSAQLGFDGGETYGLMLVRKAMGEDTSWRPVEEFMEQAQLADRTSAERRAVYRLLAELVVRTAKRQARRNNVDLSLIVVARCAGHIASIFDEQFPGYVAAGLAPVVAIQMQRIATGA